MNSWSISLINYLPLLPTTHPQPRIADTEPCSQFIHRNLAQNSLTRILVSVADESSSFGPEQKEQFMKIVLPSKTMFNTTKVTSLVSKAAAFTKDNWREIAVAVITVAIVEDLDDLADQ